MSMAKFDSLSSMHGRWSGVSICRVESLGLRDAGQSLSRYAAVVLGLLASTGLPADPFHDYRHETDQPQIHEEIIVYGRAVHHIGAATSASEGLMVHADFRLRPLLRTGELVEAVPGIVATQHSGSGKANQYFLRGFNLDHGTDLSAHVDGVPVNMRSHGHGQGYLDLNFIIPELIERVEYRKGVHHPEKGDFSTAGSVDFTYFRRVPEPFAQATVGEHGYIRGLGAWSGDIKGGVLIAAVDETRYDGPWLLDEDLRQTKLHLGYGFRLGDIQGQLALHSYHARWSATDQLPRRAVRDGRVRRMGFIDPDLGGDTSRVGIVGRLETARWDAGAYRFDYDFSLFSNFTYLLDDPVLGDEFEQGDARTVSGLWGAGETHLKFGNLPTSFHWGVDARFDNIDEVGLYGTLARKRTQVRRRDSIQESSIGVYGKLGVHATERIRAALGLRADYFDWEVSGLDDLGRGVIRDTGGEGLFSPKFSIAYRFLHGLEGYANWGRGFHSNDVRQQLVADDTSRRGDADLFAISEGFEFGLRFEPTESFNASVVWFEVELDSELVYVGDSGQTEASDASNRHGLEVFTFWSPTDRLSLNAAFTRSHAEFDSGGGVVGAVGTVGSLGTNALLGRGFHAGLSVRYLGEAPLNDDGSVQSRESWLTHLGVGWQYRRIEIAIDVFNLLDSTDDDIAYYYRSRLPGEPEQGVLDTHFHPLEPRTVRLRVAARL